MVHQNNTDTAVMEATPQKSKCDTCRWWRIKSEVDDRAMGICDNPKTSEMVRMMNSTLLARYFIKGETDREKTRLAAEIYNSIRMSSEFGCINHEM